MLLNTDTGVDIYYQEFGEGTPIIFTNSGNAVQGMWDQQVAELSRGNHTITYDWRGTGSSSRPRTGYTAEAATNDLIALINQLTDSPAILVGHGMGAHISLLAALKQPERVRGLVLADGAPWYSGERDGVTAGMSAAFLAASSSQSGLSYPDTLDRVVMQWLFRETPSDALRYAIVQDGLKWPLYVLDEYDRSMMDLDHRAILTRVSCPTVIIHGRYDRKQAYEGGVYLSENIPDARLVTFENSAHMGQLEQTSDFNRVLAELIRSTSTPLAE